MISVLYYNSHFLLFLLSIQWWFTIYMTLHGLDCDKKIPINLAYPPPPPPIPPPCIPSFTCTHIILRGIDKPLPPLSHDEWINLVQEQLNNRDQELHHWQDTLYSLVQALDQVRWCIQLIKTCSDSSVLLISYSKSIYREGGECWTTH